MSGELSLFCAPALAPGPAPTVDPAGRLEVWLQNHLSHGKLVLTSDSFGVECWSGIPELAWRVTIRCPCTGELITDLADQVSGLNFCRSALILGNRPR